MVTELQAEPFACVAHSSRIGAERRSPGVSGFECAAEDARVVMRLDSRE